MTRDNEEATEDVALAKKTSGLDIGRLKGNTARPRPFPVQSQAKGIPLDLSSLHEEVEVSLDGRHTNGKLFATLISREAHCRVAIPSDGVDKQKI